MENDQSPARTAFISFKRDAPNRQLPYTNTKLPKVSDHLLTLPQLRPQYTKRNVGGKTQTLSKSQYKLMQFISSVWGGSTCESQGNPLTLHDKAKKNTALFFQLTGKRHLKAFHY